MLAYLQFNEITPSAPGTAASSQPVVGSEGANGIASGGGIDQWLTLTMLANFTGATGGAYDVYAQTFVAGHWWDIAHFHQVASGAPAAQDMFRFGLGSPFIDTDIVIGMDLTPALQVGHCTTGSWGEKIRLLFVAGAGTSAGGSVQVTLCGQLPRLHHGR